MALFVFQSYPVCDFGKFISLILGTGRSVREFIINYLSAMYLALLTLDSLQSPELVNIR